MRQTSSLPLTALNRAVCLGLAFCLLLLAGCGKKASEEIDYGTFTNSVYQNQYFGLKLPLPAGWSVQDQESSQRLMEKGTKMMMGDDKNMKAIIKASEQQTVNLITAFQFPIGSPVPFNPSVISVAERIRGLPGVTRGKDYHYHARKLLETSQMRVTFPKEITTEKLGGTDFDVMYVNMSVGPRSVSQKYYTTIMKGYALSFIVSYNTPEDEAKLATILQGMSFK
jgi:hypothetical protein